MRTFASAEELLAAVGEHLGYSEWEEVTQERVDLFAEATGDHQWIHVDPARAAAGPFGTTIAHGFLTLSLLPTLTAQIYRVEGIRMGINYGLDLVRFPAPLPTGSKVRAGLELLAADDKGEGWLQLKNRVTIEREGHEKPVCVAESLTRILV
ncbi:MULTISPECIES: MaoC family dehydratase [Dactylosporangium]|uniref:MaoC family dehydratase n=2 Tax=Dactylosporangium TaxID=35753 RepID=A0A9W6NN83_9ACTN|nr:MULTISPECIES: MaoC family dehydratase [Dactylosporangium]UAB96526.1 MaoC family dehydratase [Dactylosporangium vinaceum]UWZ44845.1 MaoC family dehydratase [Dactylosporangium matsuzakiense]GLL03685.1 MaoC family dehydratase [Dactylosporangium matsuzakiense]